MFQSSAKFPVIDYWTNEMASLSAVHSQDDSVNRTSPDHHHRRSCSPEPFGERKQSSIGSAFMKQLTFGLAQPTTTPQVSYLPETVNAFWTSSASRARVEKPNPPKRYVFEASPCCATPRIRVVHECCNKETPARELIEEPQLCPRRVYPAPKLTLCRFCLKNGEPPSVYYSHNLHLEDGRVSCPILRRYDCPICKSGGGDHAHTVRYCPALRANTRR